MKVANEVKTNGGLLKKILICCAVACVVIASVVLVAVIKSQGGTKEIKRGYVENGIYYATPEEVEASGVADAPIETKGGAFYVSNGTQVTISAGVVLEGYTTKIYGGAVYVEAGGTFILDGGIIQFNEADYGGAIYAEAGATVILNSGKIICNTGSTSGPAVYVEEKVVEGVTQTATVETQNASTQISNNYNESYDSYVAFYVDGVFETAAPMEFMTDNEFYLNEENYPYFPDLHYYGWNETLYAPLDYLHCLGYFVDPEFTHGIDRYDNILTSGAQSRTVNGITFYDVYTKKSTPITYNGDREITGGTPNSEGEIVIPKACDNSIHGSVYFSTEIAKEAFYNRDDITAVYFPTSTQIIGARAFWGCDGIKNILLQNGLKTIKTRAFQGLSHNMQTELVIPNSVTTIEKYAFWDWKSDSSTPTMTLKLSNQLTVIESGVFGQGKITAIDFNGAPITKIKNQSFHYNLLTSLNLPNTLLSIYDHAFDHNDISSTFKLPASVHDVGTGAFDYNSHDGSGAHNGSINGNNLYTLYNGGYYLGKEDHNYGELYPTTQTVGGQYYNPYYFLVGFISENLNTYSYTDEIETRTCYAVNPYMKFMSTETIYVLRQKLGNNKHITQTIPTSGNSYTRNTDGYTIRYSTHAISGSNSEANLWIEYLQTTGSLSYFSCGTREVFVPFIFADYQWGCFRGVVFNTGDPNYGDTPVDTWAIPAEFSYLGNFFTLNSTYDTHNTFVPDGIRKLYLTGGTIIYDNALRYCNFREVRLADSIKTIGEYAFNYMDNLEDVYVGKGVESIGNYAFVLFTPVNIHYAGTIEEWAKITFARLWKVPTGNENIIKGWDLYIDGSKVTKVTINTNIINGYAFENCNLEEVYVTNTGRLNIGVEAFCYCRELTMFDFNYEKSVYFGSDCFWSCRKLRYMVISNGSTLDTTILGDCTALKYVFISNNVGSFFYTNIYGNSNWAKSTNVNFYLEGNVKSGWDENWNDVSHSSTRGNTGRIYKDPVETNCSFMNFCNYVCMEYHLGVFTPLGRYLVITL